MIDKHNSHQLTKAKTADNAPRCYSSLLLLLRSLLAVMLVVVILSFSSRIYWAFVSNMAFLRITRLMTEGEDSRHLASLIKVPPEALVSSERARVYRAKGISLLLSEHPKEALGYLNRARQTTGDTTSLYWLGVAYDKVADYHDALIYMYKAGNSEYFPDLSKLPDAIVLELARQVLTQPISARAHLELAKLVYKLDTPLAYAHFESALQSEPDNMAAVIEPAWFYLRHGDMEHARLFGERALQFFPGEIEVQLFWARFYLAQGKTEKALDAFEKLLLQVSPTSYTANVIHYERGRIYYRRKDFNLAIQEFLEANDIRSDQWGVQIQLAQVYAQIGACDKATEFLSGAEQLLPNREAYERHYVPILHDIQKLCPQKQ